MEVSEKHPWIQVLAAATHRPVQQVRLATVPNQIGSVHSPREGLDSARRLFLSATPQADVLTRSNGSGNLPGTMDDEMHLG